MQSIDSLRELNAKLLAEIAELRKENTELKDKNAEIPDLKRKFADIESEKVELKARIAELLRQAVEESKRRDVENAELKARIEELEKNKTVTTKLESENAEFRDRITKVKQNQSLIDNFSNNTSPNFNSDADQVPTVTHYEKPLVDTSLPEDKETDAFLDEMYKKKVNNEIRQRNKEKKLLRESFTKDSSGNVFTKVSPTFSVTQDKESRSHKKKETENIMQDIFDFTMDESEKNHMTEISLTGREENNYQKKIESQRCLAELSCSDVLQNINRLYENACTVENKRVKANQVEILYWRNFIIGLDNSIVEIMIKEKVEQKRLKD